MLALDGLDARRPLAYLAALGALTLLADDARLAFTYGNGIQRPTLHGDGLHPDCVCGLLADRLAAQPGAGLDWHDPSIPHYAFGRWQWREQLAAAIRDGDHPRQRMIAAAGSETPVSQQGSSLPSPLYMPPVPKPETTIAHYAQTLLAARYDWPLLLSQALFEPWGTTTPLAAWRGKGTRPPGMAMPSLGLDPGTRREHGYEPQAPSASTSDEAVPGAVALALHAFQLFPSVHSERGRATRGFIGQRADERMIWPLWHEPLSPPGIEALLSHPRLYADRLDPHALPFDTYLILTTARADLGHGKYALHASGATAQRSSTA